jgi:hypothetical protein
MEMGKPLKSVLAAGAHLVLRSWRTLIWAHAVGLLLGIAAALPAAINVSAILDHSLEAERLVRGFDLGVFFSLLLHPEVTLSRFVPSSIFVSLLYLPFMLFFTGGLLADYRHEQRLSFGAFLAACAAYFWRFVRLLLFLLLALVPVGILYGLLSDWTGKLADRTPRDAVGFWLAWGSMALTALLFIIVRLWFDVAQIRAIAENEPKIHRALGKAFRITFGSFGSLFWIFLRIGIAALAGSAAAAWFFLKMIRPEQIWLSILLGQLFVFFWLAIRFWLRACETVWYQRKFPAPVAFVEAPATPAPIEFEPPSLLAPPLATPSDETSS